MFNSNDNSIFLFQFQYIRSSSFFGVFEIAFIRKFTTFFTLIMNNYLFKWIDDCVFIFQLAGGCKYQRHEGGIIVFIKYCLAKTKKQTNREKEKKGNK